MHPKPSAKGAKKAAKSHKARSGDKKRRLRPDSKESNDVEVQTHINFVNKQMVFVDVLINAVTLGTAKRY
ncbi:unnamed protein product [Thelazia callipaeda]|uniref:40S ribosomal protein S25 n=1 Tax=Thelazia callipaeda TaxID=103827 RepID=A0A0N5DCK6_THECL|nr:unnamed protein product [Thelazia callipaeda]